MISIFDDNCICMLFGHSEMNSNYGWYVHKRNNVCIEIFHVLNSQRRFCRFMWRYLPNVDFILIFRQYFELRSILWKKNVSDTTRIYSHLEIRNIWFVTQRRWNIKLDLSCQKFRQQSQVLCFMSVASYARNRLNYHVDSSHLVHWMLLTFMRLVIYILITVQCIKSFTSKLNLPYLEQMQFICAGQPVASIFDREHSMRLLNCAVTTQMTFIKHVFNRLRVCIVAAWWLLIFPPKMALKSTLIISLIFCSFIPF